MIRFVQKYPVLGILCFAILMLGFTLWLMPVSIMEARNFITAREMLMDDHWFLTTMNGEARYEKPPLPTWITAFFGSIFGITSLWALRLPTIICVGLIGIYSFYISKELSLSKSHSLRNAFVAMTSFYVIGIIIEAPWDIYAHGFMLMGIYYLLKTLKSKSTLTNGLLFTLCIAASTLSKGPVSLYALLLPFLIAYGIVFHYAGGILKHLKLITLLVLGIAIGGLWYLYVRIADPLTFAKIAARETSNWTSYNVRPFYYYWSFFTQSGLWTLPAFISLLYPYMKNRVHHLKAYRFTLLWTLSAVILLSLVPEKKSRYLMPVLLPLALNVGFYLEFLVSKFKILVSKKETFLVYFNFGLVGALGIAFPIIGLFVFDFSNPLDWLFYGLASITLLTVGCCIFKKLYHKNLNAVIGLCFLFMVAIGVFVIPLGASQKQDAYKPLSHLNNSGIPLYSLGGIAPEAIWDYGTKIPDIKTDDGIKIPTEQQFYLIMTANENPLDERFLHLYNLETASTYDLNRSQPDSRNYKNRLKYTVYKLKRN